ncbi:MAG: zinc-binding alcohol dehydrogenase [Chloroflexi bacterium]|nr:zinc-binding alcohol dehydrogenase [Chloroflexota bacterium]
MAFSSYEEGLPAEGQFRVDTLYTGLSSGTELSFFKGSNPYLHLAWDEELGVFGPGEPSIRFPVRFIGYMEVGRVAESRTAATEPGEIVAMTYGHKTGHTADARHDFWMPLPPEIEPILGIYVAQMGPICANGLLHAAADLGGPTLGDRAADGGRSDPGDAAFLGDGVRGRQVLVVGGGVVGLLTGLFALHHGAASVALADRTPQRLAAAARLGLIPLDEQAGETWRWCKERWRHGPKDRGADVVFQCRGQAAGLQTALRSLRPQGTVIDMAFYQDGAADVRLGEEFHHNGLTIRCAQIGRVPRGLAHAWDRRRLAAETVALLQARGRLVREHLITDVVPFDKGPQLVADLAARKRHTIQAVFQVGDVDALPPPGSDSG